MKKLLLLICLLLVSGMVVAQDEEPVTQLETPPDPARYEWTEVAGGFQNPLYVTNAGDDSGRLFVVEQTGRVWIVQDGERLPEPFMDISNLVSQDVLNSYSERGLLGLAFHPDYAENGTFFVHYSDGNGHTVIARYQAAAAAPNMADLNSAEVIFTHQQPYFNHNGGQIEFGPDGYLYIGMGDGGSQGDPENRAQNPEVLLGKILRIDVDGDAPYAIPDDNPANGVNPELAPEVWALGLRNPYRFSFDRATGDLYIADVGQNQWEEINYQPADSAGGENYGWRVFEADQVYTNDPQPENPVMPVAKYDHSQGCSVTGGYVYRGAELPELHGVYIYGDWCSGRMWATYRDSAGEWQTMDFAQTQMMLSGFGEDEQGELYALDYNGGGLFRLTAG